MSLSRRNFVLKGLGLLATASLLPKATLAQTATNPPPIVDEKEPLAASLGYCKDASKVDTKKWTKRAAADGKTQFCKNCQLYAADKDGNGKCTLFQMRLVSENGWCNGWVKKAG